jgi:hypothetical protein
MHRNLVMNAVLALILALLAAVKPFADAATGNVCLQAMGCVWLTSYASISFLQSCSSGDADSTAMSAYATAMGVVVLLVNLAFVICLLWRLQKLLQLRHALKALLLWVCVKFGCAEMPVKRQGVLDESVPAADGGSVATSNT